MATTYPVLRWQVGGVRISRIVEIEGASPGTFFFEDGTPEKLLQQAWMKPHFMTDEGRLNASIHCFIVESKGKTIAVDTCVGNDKPRAIKNWNLRQGRFMQDLAEAGFPPERIDTVLCTHLHVDHVGWNTLLKDGKWVPTFPAARYLFVNKEYIHWANAEDEHDRAIQQDSVRPILDAGLAQLVETDHKVTPEVWLEPTPGHTPGHVSVRISSDNENAVITGDLMHHPVQCALPDMAARFDVDAAAARKTRREFLERYKDGKVLVLGTHFASPTAGRIVRNGAAFRFEAS